MQSRLDSISTWHSANKTAAYAEAAVRGHMREWLAPAARFNVIDLGAPPAHPSASVVVPFDGVSDLVRCRMGMFALDAAMADIEVIYVTESAAQYRLAERLLGDLRSAYGLPLRLIVPDRELPKGALLWRSAFSPRPVRSFARPRDCSRAAGLARQARLLSEGSPAARDRRRADPPRGSLAGLSRALCRRR